MKKTNILIAAIFIALLASCGTAKSTGDKESTTDGMTSENRMNTSLLNQIRRLKGMTLQSGVPVFSKSANSLTGTAQPLYVVNDYTVGNSFASVKDIVNPVDVESIKAIQGADASFYGSRGANGVIVIKTKE